MIINTSVVLIKENKEKFKRRLKIECEIVKIIFLDTVINIDFML